MTAPKTAPLLADAERALHALDLMQTCDDMPDGENPRSVLRRFIVVHEHPKPLSADVEAIKLAERIEGADGHIGFDRALEAAAMLRRLAPRAIKDLSHTISFNDGMDDDIAAPKTAEPLSADVQLMCSRVPLLVAAAHESVRADCEAIADQVVAMLRQLAITVERLKAESSNPMGLWKW